MSEALPQLSAGVWQHYKGPLYLVLGYGHDANVEHRDVVVYVGLYTDPAKPGPRLSVRTVEDFHARVHRDTGQMCSRAVDCDSDGCTRRFTYLGPTWQPEGT